MWKDKTLYWAWEGGQDGYSDKPPTTKRIHYAEVLHRHRYANGPKKGQRVTSKLAVGVWDDEKYTPINKDEIDRHIRHGAELRA